MSDNKDWWRGAVIYQIYPRSFSDSNGDGVGDLRGIVSKLDHVASLGVDGIWISPFFKSPMKDFGYDISDYRDVDPVFGTIEDFKRVTERAHELGLKVLIDQVWSHSSDQHDWFKESRQSRDNAKHDWYIWANAKADGTPPNNWMSWFGGPAWTWDARRRQYYLHHFLKEQPSMNLWNPSVRQAIKHIVQFWMDIGVDGFRLDVANTYLCDRNLRDNPARPPEMPFPADPPESNPIVHQVRVHSLDQPENIQWLEELRELMNTWPESCLLGEAGICEDSEAVAAAYTQTGKRMHMCYSFGLLGTDMTKEPVLRSVGRVQELIGDGWVCWAVSNHDFKRSVSRIKGEAPIQDKALYATALGLTLRGSYCMFQGEELGLPQAELAYEDLVDPYDRALYPEHPGRDGGRTPIPWIENAPHAGFSVAPKTWLPLSAEHLPLSVDMQERNENSTLHHVRRLIAWKKSDPVICYGDMEIMDTPDHIIGFKRSKDGEEIVCIFNAQCDNTAIPMAGVLHPLSHNARLEEGALLLAPYGYAFVETVAVKN